VVEKYEAKHPKETVIEEVLEEQAEDKKPAAESKPISAA
jgi:hypothetical protein